MKQRGKTPKITLIYAIIRYISQTPKITLIYARRYVEYTDHVSLKYTTVRRGKIHTKFAPYTIF